MKLHLLALGSLALATLAPLAAQAADELNVSPGYSIAGAPLAVHGYDTVAYFTEGKPVLGSDKYAFVHGGAAYRFASPQNMETFKANPVKYEPQYGGFCAFGVSVNKKFDGDPRLWTISGDKLYLNLNEDIYATFKKDVTGNIGKADQNWVKIKSSSAAKL